jgi:hypothetical protein
VNAKKYQRIPVDRVVESYARTRSVWKTGEELGIAGQTVASKLKKAGIRAFQSPMTEEDRRVIREYYETTPVAKFDLNVLANQLGRTRHLICRRAREMGLTIMGRVRNDEVLSRLSEKTRERWKNQPHPRGYLGYKHGPETRKKLSVVSKRHWDGMSEDQKADLVMKQLRTKVDKYGSVAPNVRRGSWKAGWREIGTVRKFFRSRWEANYARYLEWLKQRGEISEWQHEPETFWFEAIKRGVRSYLPDFKVTELGGSVAYHEVKGWFDARSKTTIRRMAKYHPTVKLVVIDKTQYASISKTVGALIEGWE